jgi:hypothetical protein
VLLWPINKHHWLQLLLLAVHYIYTCPLPCPAAPCLAISLQLFANSDIGNMIKDKSCCPPKDYMEAQWGRCPPVQCERDRSFDFRAFCSTKVSPPHHLICPFC